MQWDCWKIFILNKKDGRQSDRLFCFIQNVNAKTATATNLDTGYRAKAPKKSSLRAVGLLSNLHSSRVKIFLVATAAAAASTTAAAIPATTAAASTTAAAIPIATTAACAAARLGTETRLAVHRTISAWNKGNRGLLAATGALHHRTFCPSTAATKSAACTSAAAAARALAALFTTWFATSWL